MGIRWKLTKLVVPTQGAPVEIAAFMSPDAPGLAVHASLTAGSHDYRRWVITHAPSGFALVHGRASQFSAQDHAETLHRVVAQHGLSWETSVSEIKSNPIYADAIRAFLRKPKVRRKLPKGVQEGDGRRFLAEDMQEAGLVLKAGGHKYQYWGRVGGAGIPGVYVRLAKRTARVVVRTPDDRKRLEDHGAYPEVYYGQIAENRAVGRTLIQDYLRQFNYWVAQRLRPEPEG